MKKTMNLKKKIVAMGFAVMMAMGMLQIAAPAKVYAASVDADGAKQVALKSAGFDAGSVKSLKCTEDYDDNEYVVRFKKGSYTYRYEVRKSSSVISEMSRKRTKIKKSSGSKAISKAKAKKIAYKKLGIKSASHLEREKDRYYGAKVWEVSFDKGKYEYEFKIDRYSGKILYYEKSID